MRSSRSDLPKNIVFHTQRYTTICCGVKSFDHYSSPLDTRAYTRGIGAGNGGRTVENESGADLRPKRALRVLSATHSRFESPQLICGCPACLKRDGLELVEVVPSDGAPGRFMVVNWFTVAKGSRGLNAGSSKSGTISHPAPRSDSTEETVATPSRKLTLDRRREEKRSRSLSR